MALESGSRLGPYEILSLIGAGGMGEVYKAKDTRLDRAVAIKVLPSHLAESPERRERFEREARAVSSLNHPHICTLHDIGEQDGTHYLIMEYIEGETLADRLKKGPLSLDQALEYGIQIADALDKAHRQGVVHRDLKPGNMMLTKPGIKLLDFGLAKLKSSEPEQVGSDLSALPTEQKPLTKEGSILGTFQYMAPEQLEGKEADARTDIFAFGSVLYEMVTGKRAFEGKSQASLIGAIMNSEPQAISKLQPMSPPLLEHMVNRCLVKDPDDRWQSASDVMHELSWIGGGGTPTELVSTNRKISGSLAIGLLVGILVGAVIAGVAVWSLSRPIPSPPVRLTITPPPTAPLSIAPNFADVAISPDGMHVIYASNSQLHVRALDQAEAIPLVGSEGGRSPFVSFDGNWVGFYDGSESTLKKVSILGGPPVTICELPGVPTNLRGASWGSDNTIVFATTGGGSLFRVPAAGGKPRALTRPDIDGGEHRHLWPEILPDGKSVLFTILVDPTENMQIAVADLETGEQKLLIQDGSSPHYALTGHLIYGVAGALRAVAFDLDRLEVVGDPVPVLENVITKPEGWAAFGLSETGVLVHVSGEFLDEPATLVWVDREGRETDPLSESRPYGRFCLSPDGTQVAISLSGENRDIWIYDLIRQTFTRFTFDLAADDHPLWTPDGQRVLFRSRRDGGGIFWKLADGTGSVERLTTSPNRQVPYSFSRDGRTLVFYELHEADDIDINTLELDGDRESESLLATPYNESRPMVSPDGNWIAYQSDESGRLEIYVRPFPNVEAGGKWQISTDSGDEPFWGPDGRELFYRGPAGLMVVSIETEPTFTAGPPEVVFNLTDVRYVADDDPGFRTTDIYERSIDITAEGDRFMMIKRSGITDQKAKPQINIILNWFDELKRLAPTDN